MKAREGPAGSIEVQIIKQPNELVVHIKKADHLLAVRKDKCNAFVKVRLRVNKTGTKEQKTKVIKKSKNPVFNTILRFKGEVNEADTIELLVYAIFTPHHVGVSNHGPF